MKTELFEGGNVFKDPEGTVLTKRINRADVMPTIQWLENITGLELTDNLLGTTGKKETSGDLDIAVNANEVDKNEFAAKLGEYIKKQGSDPKDWIRKSGVSVHFKTPIKGDDNLGYVQADFMFGEPEWMKWSLQGGKEGSEYRGVHRHQLLSSIARARGMKWSANSGLMSGDGKDLISKDPNEIAKKLLGQMAGPKDIASVEDIINVVKKLPNYEELVARAREDLAKDGVQLPEAVQIESYQTGTPSWFRRMMNALG
jgi:hypothetical protein